MNEYPEKETAMTRTLSEWEEAVCKALEASSDFAYIAFDEGGGYWFSRSNGIPLTYDMKMSGGGYWEFKWWDGKKLAIRRVAEKYRRNDRIAERIANFAKEACENTEAFKKASR